ncbi:MAG TPA: GNAT family N-acetyltransferase [Actinomycetes bacterium]|jgi:RimJ/RimL family protein N-acetyltransferase|nr:GNAT family N-acetyltransferase [Actinomycetes bacterium]
MAHGDPGLARGDPGLVVRTATQADVDTLVELYAAVAAEGRWIAGEAPVDRDQRRARMAAMLERADVAMFVAEAGGRAVGQLGIELARYGVADLGMLVAEGWRGRGVGSALMEAAIGWARDAGAHKIALQVWPHNQAGIALYEKFGFEREGYLRRHYRRRSGELWDAVVMGLLLPEPGSPEAR